MTYSCTVILASVFSRIKKVKDLRYLSFLKTDSIFSHFVDCEISSFSVGFFYYYFFETLVINALRVSKKG